MKNKPAQIVLLGGGYVSIWAYRSLVKNLAHELATGMADITLVCPETHHFFHGWTAESLAGIVQDQNRMSPLIDIFSKANIITGAVDEVDTEGNFVYVIMKDGARLPVYFDHLLIGIGATDSNMIEGIKEYGYQVKSHTAFLRTREDIQSLVASAANSSNASQLLSFTIAGSGLSGVELATNIAELISVLKKPYPSLTDVNPKIRLVNSRKDVLDSLPTGFTQMRRYAEKTMRNYGIELINQKKITRINADGAFLDDGSFIRSTMVISAIGQSRIILNGTETMQYDHSNRLCLNEFLQSIDHPYIWGGGDACNVINSRTHQPCVSNALWAVKHGEYAGKNIARAIQGKKPMPFTYKGLGQCASLGIGKGMGELYGFEFTGWIAWIMRWFFFNYFMPSRKVMLHEITDWMHLLFYRNRKGLISCDNEKKYSRRIGLQAHAHLQYQFATSL